MTGSAVRVAMLLLAAGGAAVAAQEATPPPLPADVAAFVEQRQGCDHFRGEYGYDAERAKFIADQIAVACTGTDKALAALRQRHRRNPAAVAALDAFETVIEYATPDQAP